MQIYGEQEMQKKMKSLKDIRERIEVAVNSRKF